MKIVTNTAPILKGAIPSLSESGKDDGAFEFNGEFSAIQEGHVFKVAGIYFKDVFLTSKEFDIVVHVDIYTAFFKEADIEV